MNSVRSVLNKRIVDVVSKSYSTSAASSASCPHLVELGAGSVVQNENKAKPYSTVPGPRALPIVGNSWRMFPIIGQYSISDVAKISFQLHEEFGEIVKLDNLIGRSDMLFVFNADEIEKCYRSQDPIPFRPKMPSTMKYKMDLRKDFFGEMGGLLCVHGEPWREFRSRVQNPFLQVKTVRQYINPIETVTNDFVERCAKILDANSELPSDFENEINKWSMECIGLILLDTRFGCLADNLAKDSEPQKMIDILKFFAVTVATLELKMPFWHYLPLPLWDKYVENMDYFRGVCMKYISKSQERLKAGLPGALEDGEPSLLERLLMKEKSEKMATIMALDLLLVGIHTVSTTSSSILYQLATRPVEQQKLFEELKQNIPDPDMPLTMPIIDQNQYTKGFIKEVQRKYSTVIGNGRTLQEDTVICGYQIPKGVEVIFPNLVTANMEKYVTNAAQFKPERWIKSPTNMDRIHPFASLPYGYGARMCVGRRFADLEMQVLIMKLLRKYKLEYEHEPLDYDINGSVYMPNGQLKFKMTPRME